MTKQALIAHHAVLRNVYNAIQAAELPGAEPNPDLLILDAQLTLAEAKLNAVYKAELARADAAWLFETHERMLRNARRAGARGKPGVAAYFRKQAARVLAQA